MKAAVLVKSIRKHLHLTQPQLADRVGTRYYNIANYELGRAQPPGDILLRILLLHPRVKKLLKKILR
jgi:DNA-binding transcriptional regulator YiaG